MPTRRNHHTRRSAGNPFRRTAWRQGPECAANGLPPMGRSAPGGVSLRRVEQAARRPSASAQARRRTGGNERSIAGLSSPAWVSSRHATSARNAALRNTATTGWVPQPTAAKPPAGRVTCRPHAGSCAWPARPTQIDRADPGRHSRRGSVVGWRDSVFSTFHRIDRGRHKRHASHKLLGAVGRPVAPAGRTDSVCGSGGAAKAAARHAHGPAPAFSERATERCLFSRTQAEAWTFNRDARRFAGCAPPRHRSGPRPSTAPAARRLLEPKAAKCPRHDQVRSRRN
jgi:hypothetical protein